MASVTGILLLFVFLSWVECKTLLKDQGKKEKWAFICFMILAAGISMGQALQMKILNPSDLISIVFTPFGDWLFGLLK